ncbi:DUF2281 domain-containing protein [Romeria aff. gracilis LEGE 07310]|uniref:DUF2281 domain-containing protein n=1 Tax=Vasconcelosia minhoensis LEGE 07310 TaxID=915328 RepID=A0A8J7AVH3_9CYAN|nr:DUF2281 domain-containing protein [Romeria gracilis]MBE9079944.1 DUF2281 domain-containing protein [Romeria aff. gracilis LEGE 07310]
MAVDFQTFVAIFVILQNFLGGSALSCALDYEDADICKTYRLQGYQLAVLAILTIYSSHLIQSGSKLFMTALENRKKIHQQIDQLLPDQLSLLAEFLDFLQFKRAKPSASTAHPTARQPGLHPNAFVVSDDFDAPLPDSFWLGKE